MELNSKVLPARERNNKISMCDSIFSQNIAFSRITNMLEKKVQFQSNLQLRIEYFL